MTFYDKRLSNEVVNSVQELLRKLFGSLINVLKLFLRENPFLFDIARSKYRHSWQYRKQGIDVLSTADKMHMNFKLFSKVHVKSCEAAREIQMRAFLLLYRFNQNKPSGV